VVYDQGQAIVERNNKNLVRLRVGMAHETLQAIMGDPEASEGYPWGMAWQYRTALTNVAQGVEADFTPVVFDQKSVLVGWGRNFLADYRTR
jgi:hypothetical protein